MVPLRRLADRQSGQAVALYRAYYYDGGKISVTDDFEAEDDADAVELITTLVHPRVSSREVWEHKRLVYRSRPTD